MLVSLIIPCYDEADGIPQLCSRLRPLVRQLEAKGGVEIVFVDDGSRDGTQRVIEEQAAALPYRIASHHRNRGVGAAMRTGFAAARGDVLVTLDSDCSYDPERVVDLLEAIASGAEVATGSPYHPKGRVEGVSAWRLVLSRGLSLLYGFALPQRLYTYTSCFCAYRREVIDRLDAPDDGFLGVTQLLASAILSQMRVMEVPAVLTRRRYGQSKIRVLRVAFAHLWYLAALLQRRIRR